MTRTGPADAPLVVIKIGGGLSALAGALDAVCGAVSDLGMFAELGIHIALPVLRR